jgi:simple sugar transport system permease protein
MIVTFYSYKGGVGRSMALVNVGEILAQAGHDVILCDFDLEAPGLERYLVDDPASMHEFRRQPGIVDLLAEYRATMAAPANGSAASVGSDFRDVNGLLLRRPTSCARRVATTSKQASGSLRLLCAGRRDGRAAAERYATAVQRFDWSDFYDRWAGAAYFDYFRSDLIEDRTIVLIDSRTGVTELGGVCTHHLADLAILLSGPNDINIEGTKLMLHSLAGVELSGLRGGRPLQALPVAARVETTSQVRELASFRQRFEAEFSGLVPGAVGDGVRFLRDSEIPYVPYYAFTEQVVARAVETQHRELYSAYEAIAQAISAIGVDLDLIAAPKLGGFTMGPAETGGGSSFQAILEEHSRWVASNGSDGSRAVLRSWDLRQHRLDGAILRDADLTEANLEQANLRGIDLAGAALNKAILRSAIIDNGNLTRADLSGADLTRSELHQATLDFCRLDGANCTAASITESRMRDASLRGTRLNRATLNDSDLRGTDLTDAELQGTALGGADLRGAKGVGRGHPNLRFAMITSTTRLDAFDTKEASKFLRSLTSRLSARPETGAVAAAIAIFIFFFAIAPTFRTLPSFSTVLYASSTIGIVAVGVALLMIGGEFDLSSGVNPVTAALCAALLSYQLSLNMWVGVFVSLLVALGIGFINGYLVVRTRMPSFLITLSTFLILYGINLGVAKAVTGTPTSANASELDGFNSAKAIFAGNINLGFITINITVIWWLVFVALGSWILLRTRIGSWIFAAGGVLVAARAVGVPVPKVKIGLFMGVSFLCWFYGMHLLFNFALVQSDTGIGSEFIYIIAAVVGGCLLTGGYGSAISAAIGTFIFGMTTQGIVFAGFAPNWFYTFLGAMLLLGVLVNLLVKNYASTTR